MNRAEQLAYWYLRLNGFFVLPHFVVHVEPPSEIDLLAYRPPDVFEDVGGRERDWDPDLLAAEARERSIGVVCEVKSGKRYDPTTIFRDRELEYAIRRFGHVPAGMVADLRARWATQSRMQCGSLEVRKLLVARRQLPGTPAADFVSLDHCWNFLLGRTRGYRHAKERAWELFNSRTWEELVAEVQREEVCYPRER